MANAIFSSVMSDLVSRAISLLIGQLTNQRSTEAKLQALHHMVIKIQSVVEEAEERQITSHGLLSWLSELINVVYQGRYMLDIFRYGVTEASGHSDGDHEVGSQSSLSLFNPAKRLRVAVDTTKTLWLRTNDVTELDHVIKNLQLVCKNLKEFIILLGSKPPLVHRPITTTLYVDNQMFGRYVERERIINFLLSEQNDSMSKELSILPVIGHTGVGKATLVQHACVDPRVSSYFSSVLLFDSYITHSMGNTIDSIWSYDDPAQILNDKVHGRRFLIVFQDVAFQHMQKLKMILPSLRPGKRGSKIILTSNNKHVASMGTVKPIILHDLPQPEYWVFFKSHAVGSPDLELDQGLMTIGRVIAMRLKGSFLGAKIVGGLLKANPSPKFWRTVANCSAWNLLFDGNGLAYSNEIASHLLLPHVKKQRITITSSLPSNCRTQLRLENICPGDHVDNSDRDKPTDGSNSPEFDVLLCKSLFPFYNLYLVAHCTRH
ncbi:unnamed protein product [Urochloa decumbens]|uniref:NB-ARC domain-containing protein n=1 Tax=Urochloa decumbens TaxID=240449 RepID=A0ABC8VKP1_9POAL